VNSAEAKAKTSAPLAVTVIGGGLAGSECAFQLAERGVQVRLIEQKPNVRTPAHCSPGLAELVCSNSLRAAALANAVGLLKEEMRRCGSLIMACADATRVPAGGALAVDRERFSAEVTRRVDAHARIERIAAVVERIPDDGPVVLATGPLTGEALARDLAGAIGCDQLAYYDSIAPIVTADSIDWERVFAASRYGKSEASVSEANRALRAADGGGGADARPSPTRDADELHGEREAGDDYVNCPLDEAQYRAFVSALLSAEKVAAHPFEQPRYFEGCLPVEVMAERGPDTLSFGPMKPVGLIDPRTGRRPFAVVQLRREDQAGTAYNLVGFQTRMTQAEQRRVFALIPGLERARYERFGSVHRNTFVNAPQVLDDALALRARPSVHLAGQITGVEGYAESAACGLCVGVMLAERLQGRPGLPPPATTALGALLGHLRTPRPDFQPSNVVWSMFPPLPSTRRMGRKDRREALARRALADLPAFAGFTGAAGARSELAPVEATP
jgi:methylenetetrahydrofolate--tRNA-(uracil-5-)-methyltransferase